MMTTPTRQHLKRGGWHEAPEVAWDRRQRLTQWTPDISWGAMRPRQARRVNRFLILLGVGAVLAAGGTGVARADGILNVTEAEYVANYGEFVVCATLDGSPTPQTAYALVEAVMADGFSAGDAVDVINASVQFHCDEHWPLLQRVGAEARGETTARTLA